MATTSPHFNHYRASNEQNLIEELVVESIYQRGLEVVYIPRTQDNLDYLYNEDTSSNFSRFKRLAMFPLFVDGFDGGEMMSIYGDEFNKSGIFVVSKLKFLEEFPEFIRPREGDLIFMPITNAVLEIKFVEHESPFFEKGKQYVYELRTEAFEYSYEEMETGDPETDAVLDEIKIDNPEFDVEVFGDNEDIQNDVQDDIEFDPNNPFGAR